MLDDKGPGHDLLMLLVPFRQVRGGEVLEMGGVKVTTVVIRNL